MDIADLTSVVVKALLLTLWLSMPTILVASVVGVLFSLIQALTQIQEQTLSFGVKLIFVGITIFLTSRWMGGGDLQLHGIFIRFIPGYGALK